MSSKTTEKHSPLVSVVLPTYNREAIIATALDSVVRQSFQDFEIVVVDDGSTDSTQQKIEKLAYPNLRYLRHKVNRGANAARNTGIKAARGEFIAFQDSDDTWHANKLEKQVQALQQQNADIVFSAINRMKGDGKKSIFPKPGYRLQPGLHDFHAALLRGNFVCCPTLLVRSKLLQDGILFDENLPRLQDWDLCLRLAQQHQMLYLAEPLVDVKMLVDSISRSMGNFELAANMLLKKYNEEFQKDRIAGAMLHINIAVHALRDSKPFTFLKYLMKAASHAGSDFPETLATLLNRSRQPRQKP